MITNNDQDTVIIEDGNSNLTEREKLLCEVNYSCADVDPSSGSLALSWQTLRDALDREQDGNAYQALLGELLATGDSWIEELVRLWISPGEMVVNEFARLAAIMMLGKVAAPEAKFARLTFEKLQAIVESAPNTFAVDARVWALTAMEYCNLELSAEDWQDRFDRPAPENSNGSAFPWIESEQDAVVRARSVRFLGLIAGNSSRVRCWDNTSGNCDDQPQKCRLPDSVLPDLERRLAGHWHHEIDWSVTRQLVEAMGYAGGFDELPAKMEAGWKTAEILRAAAESDDSGTQGRVPLALERIAVNILHRRELSTGDKITALRRLVAMSGDLISALQETSGSRYGATYETQRRHVLAIKHLAQSALKDLRSEENEDIVRLVVGGLLLIAAGNDKSVEALRPSNQQAVPVRKRALMALDELASDSARARQILVDSALPQYELMFGDPSLDIARSAAANVLTLVGEEKAAAYFVNVLLDEEAAVIEGAVHYQRANEEPGQPFETELARWQIRRLVAETLGAISENGLAQDALVKALPANDVTSARARDALIVMGGERAVNSIINHNLQQQVTERFFEPMEEARNKGWELLDEVRGWAESNYRYAYAAAICSMFVGIAIFIIGAAIAIERSNAPAPAGKSTLAQDVAEQDIPLPGTVSDQSAAPQTINTVQPLAEQATNSSLAAPIASSFLGLLLSVGSAAAVYFWDPAKGLIKVSSELSTLIMSFENYLGRMRLIGLGFAHAYTQNDFKQLEFLSSVSTITAEAMRESAASISGLGSWPESEQDRDYATVPYLLNKPLDEARKLAAEAKLEIDLQSAIVRDDLPEETVLVQDPAPGAAVITGTKIKVTPSSFHQAALGATSQGAQTLS